MNAGGCLYFGGVPLRRLHDDGSTAQTRPCVYAQFGIWTNPPDQHIIALSRADGTGGGYGDFANTDPITGTLLESFSNPLVRLGCGPGCGIGTGLAVLGCTRRRSVIGHATPATEP